MGSSSRPRSPETQLGQLNKKKKDNNKHFLSFRPAERKSDTLYFSGAVNQVQCVFHQPPVAHFRKTRAALHKRFGDGSAHLVLSVLDRPDSHSWLTASKPVRISSLPAQQFILRCFHNGTSALCLGYGSPGGAAQCGGR